MRNLKKVLALVLAMAMSLSLAVTAGAAFNDQDKIVNTEAVDVCVSLGIINGRTNGDFDPAGNVTRAEMAKMICIVLNGGKEPNTATKATPTYADIDGHWAEGYIEYCSAKGVVAGVGGGNFNPNGSVTGSQAAKMLLVALGYNADVEKMVGANWELYTNVLANQDGLYEDLEAMDPSAALTRDNAAQMIYNTLNAMTIKVTSSIDRNDGSIVDSYDKTDDSLLNTKFGAVKLEGVIVANEASTATAANALTDAGKTTLVLSAIDGEVAEGEVTLNVSTGYDVLGRCVEVFAKDITSGTTYKTVYGDPIVCEDNNVVTYTDSFSTEADLWEDAEDAAGIKNATGATVVTNFGAGVAALAGDVNDLLGLGIEATIIDNNDDDTADYILVFAPGVGEVTVYNTKNDGNYKISALLGSKVATLSGLETEDVVGIDKVAKEDIVLFYQLDGKTYVEKVNSFEGKVTATKSTNKITVDGTVYEKSALVSSVTATAGQDVVAAAPVGTEATFYVDADNNIVFIGEIEKAEQYALVAEVEAGNTTTSGDFGALTKAVLIMADGSKVVAPVAKIDTTEEPTTAQIPEGLYTYEANSDGEYTLTTVAAADGLKNTAADLTKVEKGKAATTGDGNFVADSNTIFVVKNSTGTNSYTAYTGIANVPTTNITGFEAVVEDGIIEIVYVTAGTGGTTTDDALFVLDTVPAITEDEDGDPVYTYSVIYKGEVTTIEGNSASVFAAAGLYIAPTINSDGVVTASGAVTASSDATIAANGVLKNGAGVYAYDDNTVVYVYDISDKEATESAIEEIELADADAGIAADRVAVLVDADSDNNYATMVVIVRA